MNALVEQAAAALEAAGAAGRGLKASRRAGPRVGR